MGGIGLGGGGYGGGYGGSPLGNKKVVPTFGVSFGLPYPSNAVNGYPINPFGGAPAPNQHFGSLSPNGLNLGLVNVNPLVSFQVAKNELGEKLFKPLVNLHVTPNENIIQKVGDLWKSKKFGLGGGPTINEHYHTHTHYPNPPEIYHPHHEHHPHHYEHYEHHESQYQGGHYPSSGPGGYPSGPGGYPSGPGGFSSGPGGYPGGPGGYPSGPSGYPGHGGYGFASGPQGYYRDGSSNSEGFEEQSDPNQYPPLNDHYNANGYNSDNNYYNTGRSYLANGTQNQITDQTQFSPSLNYQDVFPQNQQLQTNGGPGAYADYASYNQQPNAQSQTAQAQKPSGQSGQSVAFPTSRRKRSTDNAPKDDEQVEGRISNAGSSSVEKVK